MTSYYGNLQKESAGLQITDLEFLKNLTKLTSLNLNGKNINDLSPLSTLGNLEWITLWDTNVSDLSPLNNLKGLKSISVKSPRLSDVKFNGGFENLSYLHIDFNSTVSEISLNDLPSLETIKLNNDQTYSNLLGSLVVTDLPKLRFINAKYLLVEKVYKSMTPLLEYWWINGSKTTDYTFIGPISPLESGDPGGIIFDDSPLLENLTLINIEDSYLDLSNTNIKNLSGISSLTHLTTLILSNSSIEDYSLLPNFDQLTELNLSNTSITDLSPLAGMTHLTTLNLKNTSVVSDQINLLKQYLPSTNITY